MLSGHPYGRTAPREGAWLGHLLGALVLIGLLGGCASVLRLGPTSPSASPAAARSATPQPAPAPPPGGAMPAQGVAAQRPVLPFDEAVLKATDELFAGVRLTPAEGSPPAEQSLVIDPLIDSLTGAQSIATRSMQSRIVDLVREKYPRFDVQRFSGASLAKAPLVLLGSLAGIGKEGRPAGAPEAYRIWLVLADLKTGKLVAKGIARARAEDIDALPAPYFRDSPAWLLDRNTEAYLKTCGAKAGDPIDPVYLDGILAASLISDATEAYEAGRYREALDLYTSALRTPAGDQLRVYNGLYLANWRLGRRERAAEAFGKIVDYGLRRERLAVKFLFEPGSTVLWPDPRVSGAYDIWLEQIARGTARRGSCLEIVGHTSPTGSAALNERLSQLRADYLRSRLVTLEPELATRTIAAGVGSRENMIGTGADDASDALDRRVEFKVRAC